MADGVPSYTTVPGKLPNLLSKIRDTGVPSKATVAWVKSVGFTSSNDPSLLGVLRSIGFIDQDGVPTPAWKEYRGKDYKGVLGRAIQSGYQDLYSVYPDAHVRENSDLSHIFSTKTNAGKQAIDKMVSTFKSLAGEAEFTAGTNFTTQAAPTASTAAGTNDANVAPTLLSNTTTTSSGLSVNINVQLTLPETTDEKVYEAFFKAMRNHLLADNK
jgi:hypothetical protein